MVKELAKRVFEIEAKAILDLIPRLDESFSRAVELLLACRGRIVVSGMGKSGLIGRKIASTLCSIGAPALFLHPAEGAHGDAGMMARGDVVLAISNSGETEELLSLLPMVRRLGVQLISLTGNPRSSLSERSEVTLDISVAEEASPLEVVPTASTAAALAMGDALAVALLERKGVKAEDFAAYHPGGAVGKRLLLQVGDLMHTGEAIPKVARDTSFKDVIYEISSKRLGVTAVVDGGGALCGVITDGDLRRTMESSTDVYQTQAGQIMTKAPKLISEKDLAAKAVRMMEDFSITALMIVDEKQRPCGIIHLHDLLKAGIV